MTREKIIDVMASGLNCCSEGEDTWETALEDHKLFWRQYADEALTALEAGGYAIESADELTRLRADLEKAKEALRPFAKAWNLYNAQQTLYDQAIYSFASDALRIADLTLSQLENSK